jgi:hypothetical protein
MTNELRVRERVRHELRDLLTQVVVFKVFAVFEPNLRLRKLELLQP